MIDILEGLQREVKIGKHGLVFLMDCMPRLVQPGQTMDHAILEAARTSYGNTARVGKPDEDRGLIRYLMRHSHTTPVEMAVLKFYVALPIFVARQLVRHRMSTLNEYSLRYAQPKEQCYVPLPDEVRKQSKVNKQGSEGQVAPEVAGEFSQIAQDVFDEAYARYLKDVGNGIGREQARINLPLSTYTFWVWKIDLHNLFRTLSLRMDLHAQKEIRDYGEAFHALTKNLAPWAFEAWQDYDMRRGAMLLTALEVEWFQRNAEPHHEAVQLDARATLREQEEFHVKLLKLGRPLEADLLATWIVEEKERIRLEKLNAS